MKEHILEILHGIEMRKGVKILFAVESGSRSWGMESQDSDYDVRFVFYREPEEYISLSQKQDVIDEKIEGEPVIEFVGFDILKFGRLLMVSNPTTIEWLRSPILYCGKIPEEFTDCAKNKFNPLSLYQHYKSMARQNYKKYIATGEERTQKKYLYCLRGIINALWIARNRCLPPIEFPMTVNLLGIGIEVKTAILSMIEAKKEGREKDEIPKIGILDAFIEKHMENEEALPPKKVSLYNDLNKEIQKIIFKEEQ